MTLSERVKRLKARYDKAPTLDLETEAFDMLYRLALRMARKIDRRVKGAR